MSAANEKLSPEEILATLRELDAAITVPLWLFGGVAVDFLVGRWTRPHGDIDLNAWSHTRGQLAEQLRAIGYHSDHSEWISWWSQGRTGRRLEIVFLDRREDGEVELRIPEGARLGVPGVHPMRPGYMDMSRFGGIGDVRFRVCSPEGEWLARRQSVIAGRAPDPKLRHDQEVLETLIPAEVLVRLRGDPGSTSIRKPGRKSLHSD
jgi:hypothetical protein